MSNTSPKKPDVCLELAVADVFRAVINLRWVPQACFLMALGAQTAWWLGLPHGIRDIVQSRVTPWVGMPYRDYLPSRMLPPEPYHQSLTLDPSLVESCRMWLPLLCMLCTAGWGVLCWYLAKHLCPLEGGFNGLARTLAQAGGFRPPPWGVLLGGAVVLGVALALPWWPASLLWAALVAIVLLYPRLDRAGGESAVFAVELGTAAIGLAVLLLGLLAADPVIWLNAGCGVLLLLTLFAAWANALLHSGSGVRAPFRFAWALPAILPFLMLHWDSPQAVLLLCLLGLLVAPGALVIASLLHHRRALSRYQKLIEGHGFEKSLFGKDARGLREDVVRDSDDYFRVCHPEFRHWMPARTGDEGYLAWVGGKDDRTLTEESVVFRTTSLAISPLTETQDPRGRALAALLQRLLPNFKLRELEPLRKAFRDAWTVRRLTQRRFWPRCPGTTRPWSPSRSTGTGTSSTQRAAAFTTRTVTPAVPQGRGVAPPAPRRCSGRLIARLPAPKRPARRICGCVGCCCGTPAAFCRGPTSRC